MSKGSKIGRPTSAPPFQLPRHTGNPIPRITGPSPAPKPGAGAPGARPGGK